MEPSRENKQAICFFHQYFVEDAGNYGVRWAQIRAIRFGNTPAEIKSINARTARCEVVRVEDVTLRVPGCSKPINGRRHTEALAHGSENTRGNLPVTNVTYLGLQVSKLQDRMAPRPPNNRNVTVDCSCLLVEVEYLVKYWRCSAHAGNISSRTLAVRHNSQRTMCELVSPKAVLQQGVQKIHHAGNFSTCAGFQHQASGKLALKSDDHSRRRRKGQSCTTGSISRGISGQYRSGVPVPKTLAVGRRHVAEQPLQVASEVAFWNKCVIPGAYTSESIK